MTQTSMKLEETCWCGSHVLAEGADWMALKDWVTTWRAEHRHELPRRGDLVGFSTTQTARDLGWPAFRNRPVGSVE